MKFRYVMIILVLMLLVGAASAEWLEGWDYRKAHHIEGSSAGDQTNYQVKFVVHIGTGTDSGEDVYIESGKCNADFSDIRFTRNDETTLLDYWMEPCCPFTDNATFWVEVPNIYAPSGADIWMYYGNDEATSASNGDATFLFFDDFVGTTLDTGKWNVVGTPTILDSVVTLQDSSVGEEIYSKAQFPVNTQLIAQSNIGTSGTNYIGYFGSINDLIRIQSGNAVRTTKSGVLTQTSIGPFSGWQQWEIIRNNTYSVIFTRETEPVATHTTNIPDGNLNLKLYAYKSTGIVEADWIFLRNYISPEPTPYSWGPEEDNLPEDNIIMPNEMPYAITPEVVTEAGTTRFYIGGDKTFDDTALYAVSIQAPDIVLDGGHYTLTGTLDSNEETSQHAIMAAGWNNVTVYHVNATGWNMGIAYDSVDSGWIDQNNLYGNANAGIAITSCNAIVVAGNTLTDNGGAGVYACDSTNISVMGENIGEDNPVLSLISGNPDGIYFSNVTHGMLTGYDEERAFEIPLSASDNGVGLRMYQCEDITVKDTFFSGNGIAGALVDQSNGIQIGGDNGFEWNDIGLAIIDSEDCSVEDNLIEYNNASGIEILGGESWSRNIVVSGNTISENNRGDKECHGVFAFQAEDLTFLGNNLTNSGHFGLNVGNCTNVTVLFNHIADHLSSEPGPGNGIVLGNTVRANIIGNNLVDNRVGIWYHNSTFNYIMNNTVNNGIGEGDIGIGLVAGSGMTGDSHLVQGPPFSIHKNVITGYNTGIGLEDVQDILVFDNYFCNYENYYIGTGTSGISWNLTEKESHEPMTNIIGGQYLGGNFWGNPEGTGYSQTAEDADRDGICDEPYALGGTGYTDSLPLYGGFSAYFTASEYDAVQYGEDPVTIQFYDGSTGDIDLWLWDFGDGEMVDEQNPAHDYTTQGAFYVTLTVINVETEESDEYSTWIRIRPAVATGVPIWPGWNFVSVPRTLAAGNDTVATVFEGVQTGGQMVYSYNSSTHAWVAMLPPDDDKILPLDGIWIYSTQVGPFVEFDYSSDFGQVVPRIKHLEPGWNAIGMGSLYPMETASYLASLGNKWDVLLDFNDQLQTYYPPLIRGIQVGDMYPTEGYWIYMNEAGDLLAVTG